MAIEAKGAASLSLSFSRAERVARIESMSKRSQQSETSAGAAAALTRAAGQADHRVYQRRQEQRYVCLLAAGGAVYIYAGLHSDVFTQPANIAHAMNEYSLWQLQGTDPAVL